MSDESDEKPKSADEFAAIVNEAMSDLSSSLRTEQGLTFEGLSRSLEDISGVVERLEASTALGPVEAPARMWLELAIVARNRLQRLVNEAAAAFSAGDRA